MFWQDFNRGYLGAERFDGFASCLLWDNRGEQVRRIFSACTKTFLEALSMHISLTVCSDPPIRFDERTARKQQNFEQWGIGRFEPSVISHPAEVQWSSVEHSGLGMYGDEVNPWGDRQTVAQLWCRGRRNAWFFFGPGPEGPGGSVWGRSLHNENRRLEKEMFGLVDYG